MKDTNWSFDEFLAFLLIYASHADINFSKEEKEVITDAVSEDIFENIYQEFKQFTDFQALNLIMSYKDVYFQNQEEKDHLFEELHSLFFADGEFSSLEKELLQFLDRLM